MKYKDKKITQLVKEFKEHKGKGESQGFYALKQEMVEKLGPKEWERIYRKSKVMAFMQKPTRNVKKIKPK